jgi:sodium-independent sulfate anion transporter 11
MNCNSNEHHFAINLFCFAGFLIDFISGPVSVGFTSAAAIIIATTQIKDVLGLSFPGSKFLDVWEQLFEHISETRLWDTLLGFICMAVLLLLRVTTVFNGT